LQNILISSVSDVIVFGFTPPLLVPDFCDFAYPSQQPRPDLLIEIF
jgi:hypothetical protein